MQKHLSKLNDELNAKYSYGGEEGAVNEMMKMIALLLNCFPVVTRFLFRHRVN